MKKLFLLLTGIFYLSPIQLNAQRFHHTYGDAQDQRAKGSCMDLLSGSPNFCIVGKSVRGSERIFVSHPDMNGNNLSATNFKKEYNILSMPNNVPCNAQGMAITEFRKNGKQAFAIVGTIVINNIAQLFFMEIDNFGNILLFKPMDYISAANETPVAIAYNPAKSTFVFTGNFDPTAGGPSDVFITEIDTVGVVIKNYLFDIQPNPTCNHQVSRDIVSDIVLNPAAGSNDYFIVGTCNDQWGQVMGFLAGISMGLGGTGLWVYSEGVVSAGTNKDIEFYSISHAAQANGFVIGGKYRDGNNNSLVTLIDPTGAIVWSSVFDYTPNRGTDNVCIDVKETFTSGVYEYYAVGNATTGFFGAQDIQFIKMDGSGNGVINGEVTYGTNATEASVGIEILNGLYIMGETNKYSGYDHYMLHSDINGITTCLERAETPTQYTPHIVVVNPLLKTYPLSLTSDITTNYIITSLPDVQICYNAHKLTGIEKIENDGKTDIYPNPVNDNLTIDFAEQSSGKVEIYDVTGKNIKQISYDNTMSTLNIDTSLLTKGIYVVKILSEKGEVLRSEKIVKTN